MEPRFQRARDAITASPADILPDPLHGSLPYPRSTELENGDHADCWAGGRAVPDARAAYCLYSVASIWFGDLCQCSTCMHRKFHQTEKEARSRNTVREVLAAREKRIEGAAYEAAEDLRIKLTS